MRRIAVDALIDLTLRIHYWLSCIFAWDNWLSRIPEHKRVPKSAIVKKGRFYSTIHSAPGENRDHAQSRARRISFNRFICDCIYEIVELLDCFHSRGINPLTSESLEEYLKQNLTVVAMWSNKDCLNCDLEDYTMYKMVYTFSDYDNVHLLIFYQCR